LWAFASLVGVRSVSKFIAHGGRVIHHESDDAFLESLRGRGDVAEA
jgi:hypothetical protein